MNEELQTNVLFYSPKCKHSNKLLNIIKTNNYLKGIFIFENIHESKHPLLNQIRNVPCIHIQNTTKLYIGKKAFEFVESELDLHLNAFEDYSLFSFIENPDSGSNTSSNFAYLAGDGYDVPNSIQENNQIKESNCKEKKQNDEYEAFLEQRKLDMPTPLKRV
jgi:hypothetical protein